MLALAVILGAFGAHGLKDRFGAYEMGIWEKAVFYHLTHALGVLLVALIAALPPEVSIVSSARAATICGVLTAGLAIFAGTLYLLALTGLKWLGAITPIGGTLMIVGWAWLAWSIWRANE